MSQTYPIRTLADIYNLPTVEQVETCLREVSASMLAARATDDGIAQAMREGGVDFNVRALEWPEVIDWIDDDKNQVGFAIKDETGALDVQATFTLPPA